MKIKTEQVREITAILDDIAKEYKTEHPKKERHGRDKKKIGWLLGQKRPDRVGTASMLTSPWHNLYWLA